MALLVVSSVANDTFAQGRTFILLDKTNSEPISYATVKANNGNFTYSNETGIFTVEFVESIKIQHVAYSSTIFFAKSIISDTLLLEPLEVNLGSFVVNANAEKQETIGNLTKKKNFTININTKMEIVLFIPNDEYPKNSRVLSIKIPLFNLKKVEYNDLILRPKFYTYTHGNEFPDKEFGKVKETFFVSDSNQKYYSIDVSEYGLRLPDNGFYVGIELIGFVDSKGRLVQGNVDMNTIGLRGKVDKKVSKYKTFTKTNDAKWHLAHFNELFIGKKTWNVNLSLGLIVSK
ncbi:hypothetical protein [Roseivirga misakiensis]|uniref:hypothetical protein n=1 Tax=Roseivirga misakiensis TaxID=1563681 RepID=UPI00114D0FD3|nr:hypothetical protein [Roseivirga misakiensis]